MVTKAATTTTLKIQIGYNQKKMLVMPSSVKYPDTLYRFFIEYLSVLMYEYTASISLQIISYIIDGGWIAFESATKFGRQKSEKYENTEIKYLSSDNGQFLSTKYRKYHPIKYSLFLMNSKNYCCRVMTK